MLTVAYVPEWAKGKIEGLHTAWSPDEPEQRISCRCLVCGAQWQRVCTTGAARSWIEHFAVTHRRLHA